jgi:hypothetical protein
VDTAAERIAEIVEWVSPPRRRTATVSAVACEEILASVLVCSLRGATALEDERASLPK